MIALSAEEIPAVLEKAKKALEQANTDAYFEQISQLDLPVHLKTTHSEHKNKFIKGYTDAKFDQQLRIFLHEIARHFQIQIG